MAGRRAVATLPAVDTRTDVQIVRDHLQRNIGVVFGADAALAAFDRHIDRVQRTGIEFLALTQLGAPSQGPNPPT